MHASNLFYDHHLCNVIFLRISGILKKYQKYPGCWTPEMRLPMELTDPPVHQKNYLAKVCARPVLQLTKKLHTPIVLKVNVKLCSAILYCMANGS